MAQGNAGTVLRWLTERQVADLVDINDAIDALEQGFRDEAAGKARSLDKMLGTWDGGAMHALGALSEASSRCGFKTWVHTAKGASAVFSLFDTTNGQILAMLEAATLGQIRTSAVSGLAARVLSAATADDMALVGTGAQAMTQVAAVSAVRPLRRLRVFSPTAENRADFVRRASKVFVFEIVDCGSLESCVEGASIVTLITRTTDPFLTAPLVADGALVIAAGAILPANAECHPCLVQRAQIIATDSIGNARRNSRELRERFGADGAGWDDVQTLGELLQSGPRAPVTDGIAFFKPMGTGLSDLSVATLACLRAEAEGIGQQIDQPQRVSPKWHAADTST